MIYLDNAASTRPKQEVIDVMVESMKENFANADAIHEFSHKIAQKIKKSRKIVGDFLGVDGNRIFFTAVGEMEIICCYKGLLKQIIVRKNI